MPKKTDDLGQLFVIGIPDAAPSQEYLDFLNRHQIGGVILFEHNCGDYAATSEAIRIIKQQYQRSVPFVAIDQEGGRVCRLRGAPAEFRSPAEYVRQQRLEQYVEDLSRATVYMESLGINLNLAPVADLWLEETNTCLDGRCFGSTPDEAIPYIQKTVAISHIHSLLACAKHFPGLGAARVDPHVETATADYDLKLWQRRELQTFQAAVEADVDMIMTTHLLAPEIDDVIATGSEVVLNSLVRNHLNYQGVVITDDLTMKGAEPLGSYGERAVAALKAGHDVLLFGKDFNAAREGIEAAIKAVERGEIGPERVQTSLDRVASIKYKLARTAGHFI